MFEHLDHAGLLKKSRTNGADFAEVFCEHSLRTSIICEDKKIDRMLSGIDQGLGLRLIKGENTAYGCTNNLETHSLFQLADSLSSSDNRNNTLTDIKLNKQTPPFSLKIQKDPQSISLKDKLKLIQEAEKYAWSQNTHIVQVRIAYTDLVRHVEISNSLGEYIISPTTLTICSVAITTSKNGELFQGYHSMGGHIGLELFDLEKIEDTVDHAVKRALINMTAPRATGGTMPVVISSEAGGTMVHEAVGHGLEADLAGEGMSVYQNKIGETVASSLISVVEDPTILTKRGCYLFDDEGVPAQKLLLIEKGVLKNYMHSRLTAQKMGVQPN